MNIQILHLEEGAKRAKGIAVIIDVFRAFTFEPYLFQQGCREIYAVYDESTARNLKALHPAYILCGERHGFILPGFDYGNSPSSIIDHDFTDRTIIHTTSNGTLGIANAKNATDIYVASLVNAKATAEAILKKKPEDVSLVCMGWEGRDTEEDILCAEYLKSLFEGNPLKDIQKQAEDLKYTEGKKFFDPLQQQVFPQVDFVLCTDIDRFDFAIHTTFEEGLALNRKESV